MGPEPEMEAEPELEVEEEDENGNVDSGADDEKEIVASEEIIEEIEENIVKTDDVKEDEEKTEEDRIGNVSENEVLEYLKQHYKVHSANIISPHDIAKNLMKSQGVSEAQFQFH